MIQQKERLRLALEMSTIISNSLVAPSLVQDFKCKSLKYYPVSPAPERISHHSLFYPASRVLRICSQTFRSSPKGVSTARWISSKTYSYSARFQQNEDGSSVALMNAGGSIQEPNVGTPSSMAGKSLLAKLGQNINVAGIAFSSKVILQEHHLAIPHVSVPDISWIDWKALQAKGFEAILFDKDNTLTAPYGQNVWPSLLESLEECKATFDGRLALLSNSAGLYQFDPEGAEAKALEDKLGIHVIRHGSKKPSGDAQAVADHFACDPTLVVMVGDRYFTDVVYGNNNGMLTIRPAPLTSNGEPFIVRRVRALEDVLVEWWGNQGVLPTEHRLLEHPVDFIKEPGFW